MSRIESIGKISEVAMILLAIKKLLNSYFSEYTSSSFLLQGQETTKGGLSPTHNTHTPRVADTLILTNFILAMHF